ncbi:MAG: adenine phosphoribosyltransferase [Mycoplasmoidaceae bacterium]|nr:adenine phosphoribosyltransferase [Mycoplasmoidaceae bacterium]
MNKNIKVIEKTLGVIPNFPKKGISFKDITPIFAKPKIFDVTIKEMLKTIKGRKFDVVVGLESRGFWFALSIAQALKLPFVPIRKKGKLPRPTVSATYKLEYGSDTIQVHKQDIKPKDRVLIVDDIVATGGTILATKKLLEQLKVKYCELLVLGALTSECPEGIKRLRKAGIKINYLLDL